MAKRNAVELTPEEAAKALATEYAVLAAKKKEIESTMEDVKSRLISWEKDNPGFQFGAVEVVSAAPKPKLDFGTLTKKGTDQVLAQLANELPEFCTTTTKVDVDLLYNAYEHNAAVRNALAVRGVSIVTSESFTIRIAK